MKRKLWMVFAVAVLLGVLCFGAAKADSYQVTQEPTCGVLNSRTQTYPIRWATNFTPVRVEVRRWGIRGEELVETLTGVKAADGWGAPANLGGQTVFLRFYYSSTGNIASNNVLVGPANPAFRTQPACGALNRVNQTYPITWETNFLPIRVEVYRLTVTGGHDRLYLLDTPSSLAGSWDVPAVHGGETLYVEAYYGSIGYETSNGVYIGPSNPKFTYGPVSWELNKSSQKYEIFWTTSFVPTKVHIVEKDYRGFPSIIDTLSGSDLTQAGSWYAPAEYGGRTLFIEAYYGYKSITAQVVVGPSDPKFVSPPASGALNVAKQTYPVSWETNFTPVWVRIERYVNGRLQVEAFLEGRDALDMQGSWDAPAELGGCELTVSVYYGQGHCVSKEFTVGPTDPKFTDQPVGGAMNAAQQTYPISWKTNFVPIRVIIRKMGSYGFGERIGTIEHPTGMNGSWDAPAELGGKILRIEAEYGSGRSVMSAEIVPGPTDPKFFFGPVCSVLNTATQTYRISWSTNFQPTEVKVYSLDYHGFEHWVANVDNLSMYGWWDAPADLYAEEIFIKAYYGSSSYVSSKRIIVGPVPHKISFDPMGGTVNPTQIYTGVNGKLDGLPVPVRENYRFTGWYYVDNGQKRLISTDTVFYGNETVYASWSIVYHNVSVISGTSNTSIAGFGQTVTVTAKQKEGWAFSGWEIVRGNITLKNPADEQTSFTMGAEDVTLRAHYTYLPVTVTFDANGGTVSPVSAQTGSDGRLQDMPWPVREHWLFLTWYIQKEDKKIPVYPDTVFTADTTVYADWIPVTHSIRVIDGTADVDWAGYGTTVHLSADVPEGAVFTFWEVVSGGVSVAGPQSAETSFIMGAEKVVIQAHYSYIPVTVTFDANGGTCGTASAQTGEDGKLAVIPLPSRDDYSFSHWEYEDDTGAHAVSLNTVFTADTTVQAQWLPGPHTITVTDGTASKDSATPQEVVTIIAAVPDGSVFTGWQVLSGGVIILNPDNVRTTFKMGTDHVRIRARWEFIPVTVTFDANGGKCTMADCDTGSDGTLGALPVPVRNGYSFRYWFIHDNHGDHPVDTNTVFTADTTVHAMWTAKTNAIQVTDGTPEKRIAAAGETVGITAKTKTGKTFSRWVVLSGGAEITDPESASTTFVMGPKTAYIRALYEPYPVTVTFDAGGAEGVMEAVELIDPDYILPECGFTPPDRTVFLGWNLGQPGDTVEVTSNLTVTALWETGCIPLTPEFFPDSVFLDYVAETYDENGDGLLTLAERGAPEEIDCSGMGIASASGVEYFTNLNQLLLEDNDFLTELELTGSFTGLETVNAAGCGLKRISLSGCSGLKTLLLKDNPLTEISLDSWTGLTRLDVTGCAGLETLDLGGNPLLRKLYTFGSSITLLDVRNNPYLAGALNGTKTVTSDYDEYSSGDCLMRVNRGTAFVTAVVSFDPGEGRGVMADVPLTGTSFTLPECGLTPPEFHVFDGWNLGQTGDTVEVTSDLTVTALWKRLTFGPANFTLPGDITVIGEEAFARTAVEKVFIPNGADAIGKNAFAGCGSLRQIRIPASVTEIADSAFEDCPEDLMIFGAGGSRAEYFANTHGFRFVEE